MQDVDLVTQTMFAKLLQRSLDAGFDADFAQFQGISENLGDSIPPPIEILRSVDESFRAIPHVADPFVSTRYRNERDYAVAFLTPNRGSDKHADKPARMRALGGAGAEPMRHLDFLIHEPERSVLLFGGGIPVTVPRAERFAVHKLIVAVEWSNQAKSAKDIQQSRILIETLATERPGELASAWRIAWQSGQRWRKKLEAGRARLPEETQALLAEIVGRFRG